MSFAALSSYIRPEYPQYTEDENNVGNVWHYRGPTSTLVANKPAVGDAWADGRSVRSVEYTPNLDNAAISDLIVSTVFSYADSVTLSSSLDSTRYEIRWVPQELPLVQHPEFTPGGEGTYDLGEDSAETPTRTYLADIMGWEEEIDPILKSKSQYRPIINGAMAPSVYQATDASVAYIYLRKLGFDSYTVFLPAFSKVSVYSGTQAPGTGACGQRITPGTKPDSSAPDGYEWVKSADSAERVGNRAKWQRTEEWQGFKTVYFDSDEVFVSLA